MSSDSHTVRIKISLFIMDICPRYEDCVDKPSDSLTSDIFDVDIRNYYAFIWSG